jgi:hypothetical protein
MSFYISREISNNLQVWIVVIFFFNILVYSDFLSIDDLQDLFDEGVFRGKWLLEISVFSD